MASLSFVGRYLPPVGLLLLSVAASAWLFPVLAQRSNESGPPQTSDSNAKVILEVVNNHFTMGRKIPSLYLRVFSDGSAECHAVRFDGVEDSVKKGSLPPKEVLDVRTALNQPGLGDVKGRYERPRVVMDSWMEWELRASDSRLMQDVTISFGPPNQEPRPYPEALARLACQILKVREYVCGDRTEYYRPACVNRAPTK